MRDDKPNPIVEKSQSFAVRIVAFAREIRKAEEPDIARQLLKSGTSIGANSSEAQNTESPKDFLHKIKIAAKEASESRFWITLCAQSEFLPNSGRLDKDIDELIRILGAIVSSCKNRR